MEGKRPTFSIITITFNAEKWLERTVTSVLSQSYPDIEYIIIDGASKDGTVDIIKQYASGIAYWSSEPDNGLYFAMNKGLQHATGDYVWFLNAGDTFFAANTVQRVSASILKSKKTVDIIYGETAIVDADGKFLSMRRLKAPDHLTWKKFKMGMLVCHQSFVVRREIAPEYDTNYRLVADYDWCIRCMKHADKIKNSRLTLVNFLEAGMSSARRKESLKERYAIMCKYYGVLPTALRHGWFAFRFGIAKLFGKHV